MIIQMLWHWDSVTLTERRKSSVPKEYVAYVENMELNKPVLSKIMTTQE